MGRQEFCDLLDIPKQTLISIETRDLNFRIGIVESITEKFPEYTLWLMTGKTAPEAGQISPEIESTAQSYQEQGKG